MICNWLQRRGEDVPFGEDEYYKQIIMEDNNGRGFEEQRDSWKENCDFNFCAKVFRDKGRERGDGEEDQG